ncbi:MAG: class I SAM-dependent methyltransferase [Pseudomonadota bacterium]
MNPDTVKGFLDPREGERLYALGAEAGALGPCLEVGSYCGKSTLYLGSGVREAGGALFAVDHHIGSEEHQPGEGYFDPDLYDRSAGRLDTLPAFRRTLRGAGLDDTVIPIVAQSARLGRLWRIPLALVFIDGGHSFEAAYADLRAWLPHVLPGGYLAIHDLFASEAEGGQAPRTIYEHALSSGLFEACEQTLTLGVLRRV